MCCVTRQYNHVQGLLGGIEDWISVLVNKKHLWPDQYLKQLMNVIGTIGKQGGAVIVGRGDNFVLPPEGRFRLRFVAPLDLRVRKLTIEVFDQTTDVLAHQRLDLELDGFETPEELSFVNETFTPSTKGFKMSITG